MMMRKRLSLFQVFVFLFGVMLVLLFSRLAAAPVQAQGASWQLLVSASRGADAIERFDAVTGQYLGRMVYVPQEPGMTDHSAPQQFEILPNGDLLLLVFRDDTVRRYTIDPATMTATEVLRMSNPALDYPRDLAVRGNIVYVSGETTNNVVAFDWTSGAFLGEVVRGYPPPGQPNNPDVVPAPTGLAFGPDGYLYVLSRTTRRVRRFNVSSGVGVNVDAGSPDRAYVPSTGFDGALGCNPGDFCDNEILYWGPDGFMYISSRYNVHKFSSSGGILFSMGGMTRASGILLAPDGLLYVTDRNPYTAGRVLRFDPASGAALGVFIQNNNPTPGFTMYEPKGLVAYYPPAILAVTAQCGPNGVQFVVSNTGPAMTAPQDYSIDGVPAGSFQLATGENATIEAGFGAHTFTSGSLNANLTCDAPVVPPPAGGGSVVVNLPTPTPYPNCLTMSGSPISIVRISGGANPSTYCNTLNENGVYLAPPASLGYQEIIDRGVLQAVDVFDPLPFTGPVQVCLQGLGELIYMNASAMPRVPESLPAFAQGSYTCAVINAPGTVVLVNGAAPAPVVQQVNAPSTSVVRALSDCRVTTNNMLNLRSEPNPSGAILDVVPYNLTLQAIEATQGWYRVIYLDMNGWLSADFVTTAGTCN